MKKSLFLMAMAIFSVILGQSQVISTTQLPPIAKINSVSITHHDSTTAPTDIFWTRDEVSANTSFSTSFFTPWVKHTGSGTSIDILTSPLVTAGVTSFVRVIASNDTLSSVVIKSAIKAVIPKFQPVLATISLLSQNLTTTGNIHKVGFTIGKDDSAKVQRVLALDSNFVYFTTKSWKVTSDGTIIDTVKGLNSGTKFYVKWIITNSVGSKTIKYDFTTTPMNQKPAINKSLDSLSKTSNAIAFKVGANSFGLTGTLWAKCNTMVSLSFKMMGNGEEKFIIGFNNLVPNTNYAIKIFAQNSMGIDSLDVGVIKTAALATVFKITTSTTSNPIPSGVEARGIFTMPSTNVATITAAIFAGNDSTCTVALQNVTHNYNTAGTLYEKFTNLPKGGYWVRFYGTCTTGEYDLTPTPVYVKVTEATGIKEIEKEMISIYPNPTNDFIHINAPLKNDYQFNITNMIGQIVKSNILKGGEKEINVSELPTGIYFLTINTKEDGVKIAKFTKE